MPDELVSVFEGVLVGMAAVLFAVAVIAAFVALVDLGSRLVLVLQERRRA